MSKQSEKDIYYLKIARTVSLRSKCLSRKIGAVLVKDDSLIGAGFNGPAKGVAHCKERDLRFYRVLNKEFYDNAIYCNCSSGKISSGSKCVGCGKIVSRQPMENGKSICPRRYFGYKSGQGLHLCQAGHAERNALIQAARNGISTSYTTLYCYCGQVCKDCAIEIINAGVITLVFLEGPEYDNYSKVILEESGINIRTYKKEDIDAIS